MRSCRRSRPRDRKRGEPVVRCPTEAIARRPTSTSRGSTCASSRPCSRPAARGTTAECVAEGSSGAGAGGLLLRRHTHRELCDGGPIKALVRFRAYACLVVGDSNSQVDRRRGGRGPRPCVGTMLGTAIGAPLFFSQCSAVSSPARISRLRFHESHKSGGRPAPTDGYAEYDFRLRTEEQLAAGLSVLARFVLTSSEFSIAPSFRNVWASSGRVSAGDAARRLRHRTPAEWESSLRRSPGRCRWLWHRSSRQRVLVDGAGELRGRLVWTTVRLGR